ncbi:hypothetical protein JRO89_XS13G0194300 [Xanthoceras sorbifolium]|uniref:Ribosomal RNA-processing protein 40 n=1 Tax=Xanthoceras sorbifolium TaxID=99658 RepID=A0ABQ8H953_9ROSI|nr:hypothetical protein JRO89_XS13G0194300 [Xanthoceras sorbifolium]
MHKKRCVVGHFEVCSCVTAFANFSPRSCLAATLIFSFLLSLLDLRSPNDLVIPANYSARSRSRSRSHFVVGVAKTPSKLMLMEASTSPATFVDKIVVPGDVVLDLSTFTNETIKLGGGLRQDPDAISVMKAGKLKFSKPNKYWVESSQRRYVPCMEETVLGIVVDCKADNFLVDIKGPAIAFLPVLAFEGGTRRNIPKFEVGALVYVRVVKANPGMNPELSCTDAYGKAAEFGLLKDGYMFETSTGLSRIFLVSHYATMNVIEPCSSRLLSSPTCPVLEELGKQLSFEIAVGLNGRVWVNADSPSTVVVVSNAIMNSEPLSGVQQKIMVEKLLQRIK